HRQRALALLEEMAAALPDAQRIAFWHDPRRRHLRRGAPPGPSAIDLGSTISASSAGAAIGSSGAAPASSRGDPLGARSAERLVDQLFRLLEVYRRLSSEREVDRLLELAMDTAMELSGCDRGFLLLAEGGALSVAVTRNLPLAARADIERGGAPGAAAAAAAGLPYSRSIAEHVFASGELVASTDARLDPRFHRAESVHALHLGRVLCIPIRARGRVAGVLYLEGRPSARTLGEDDLRLLTAFGDQVAVVLDSARLQRESERRAAELEAAQREIEGDRKSTRL